MSNNRLKHCELIQLTMINIYKCIKKCSIVTLRQTYIHLTYLAKGGGVLLSELLKVRWQTPTMWSKKVEQQARKILEVVDQKMVDLIT